jgi:protein-disulfide isomerase
MTALGTTGGGSRLDGGFRACRVVRPAAARRSLLALLAAVAVAAGGCGSGNGERDDAAGPGAGASDTAGAGVARPAVPAAESDASAAGATVPPAALLQQGEGAGAAARPVAPDFLALERQPGATPALPQVTVPAGPRHAALAGAPGASPAMGPETASVRVFVWSDFQCPVCRRVVEPLKHLARAYGDDVQIVFKHNALPTHAHARRAAAAGVAAFRQGKFWEYHDLLFQNQDRLGEADLLGHAETLGLDLARFQTDMNAPEVERQLDYEAAMANRLGAPGTPGFFINGRPLLGWGSYPGFEAMVAEALASARPVGERGVEPARVAVVATAAAGPEGVLLTELMWGVTN